MRRTAMLALPAGIFVQCGEYLFICTGVKVINDPIDQAIERIAGAEDCCRGNFQVLWWKGVRNVGLPVDIRVCGQWRQGLFVPGLGNTCLWQIETWILRDDTVEKFWEVL